MMKRIFMAALYMTFFSSMTCVFAQDSRFELDGGKLKASVLFEDGVLKLASLKDVKGGLELLAKPAPLLKLETAAAGSEKFRLVKAVEDGKGGLDLTLAPLSSPSLTVSFKLSVSGPELCGFLDIANSGASAATVSATCPSLEGLSIGGDPANLWYCLPLRGGAISNAPVKFNDPGHMGQYGELFPMQVLDFFDPALSKGLCLICKDSDALHKIFAFEKGSSIRTGVLYPSCPVPARGSRSFPQFSLTLHDGDWHEALNIYRTWVASWYKPSAPRLDWVGRTFLWERLYALDSAEREELEKFYPGVNKVVDSGAWWWGKEGYWEGLGEYKVTVDAGKLAKDVGAFQRDGVKAGGYVSPGLLYEKSGLVPGMRAKGEDWFVRDRKGLMTRYHKEPVWRVCMMSDSYRATQVSRFREICSEFKFDFLYWDCMGYSVEGANRCYQEGHGHPVPMVSCLEPQIKLYAALRAALPGRTAFFTEFLGGDVYSQHVDGMISHVFCENEASAIPVDLFRFCFPQVKCFSYFPFSTMSKDKDPVRYLKYALFNGDAIWTHRPDRWLKLGRRDVMDYIAMATRVMSGSSDAFFSQTPVPLVASEAEGVHVNMFPGDGNVVYTAINMSGRDYSGKLVKLKAPDSATGVAELCDGKAASIKDGILSGEIGNGDVKVFKVTYGRMPSFDGSWPSNTSSFKWGVQGEGGVRGAKDSAKTID